MSDSSLSPSRRSALKCLAYGGAGTLFTLAGGVFTPLDLALAAEAGSGARCRQAALRADQRHPHRLRQGGQSRRRRTLRQTIELVNGMREQPALVIHTGDITHLSKAAEFDHAQQLFTQLRATEMHTVPGEHDTLDAGAAEYFSRFGKASDNKGYYSFDHSGVHFVALVNVLRLQGRRARHARRRAARLARRSEGAIGEHADRRLRAHAAVDDPRTVGLGNGRRRPGRRAAAPVRLGHVLNGHIHQIVQKVEGNITFHTARSTAYPQPAVGQGTGPGPLKVPAEQLRTMLGVTSVSIATPRGPFALLDTTIA